MEWIVENPWPAILAGIAVELVLGGLLIASGRVSWLIWMAVAGVVVGGLVLLERLVVTDREQIHANLLAIAKAVSEGDEKTALEFVSPSADEVRANVRRALSYGVHEASIKNDLRIDVRDDLDPPQARATFTVTVSTTGRYAGTIPFAVTASLRKHDDRWLVWSAEGRMGVN